MPQEKCIAPGVEHEAEFVCATFGQCVWKCKICGEYLDELEDSQP